MGSRRSHLSPRPPPGSVPSSIWGVLGGPWAVLGSLQDVLGAPRGSQCASALVSRALGGVIRRIWDVFEDVEKHLVFTMFSAPWGVLGRSRGVLGGTLECLWGFCGAPLASSVRSRRFLGSPWGVHGAPSGLPGGDLECLGGGPWGSLGVLGALLAVPWGFLGVHGAPLWVPWDSWGLFGATLGVLGWSVRGARVSLGGCFAF